MKRCTQCGVLNADHLDTCGSCGARGDSLVAVKEDDKASLAVGTTPPPAMKEAAPPPAAPERSAPAKPPRRWGRIAAAVAALAVVGALAVAFSGVLKKPLPPPKPKEDRRHQGFPSVRDPVGLDTPTPTGAAGDVLWTQQLRQQTHAMLTIDGW